MNLHPTALLAFCLSAALASAEAPGKRPLSPLKFRVQQLALDNNEGCDIADINKDGKPDVVAGRSWFPAPDFKPVPLRKIADWGIDYVASNGDHTFDIDGDGWADVISGDFNGTAVRWFKNPGTPGLTAGGLWADNLLGDTRVGSNEISFFRDMDGDGHPDWAVNSWDDKNPMVIWKLGRNGSERVFEMRTIGEASPVSNGHGMGFGDINGDGLEDIVYKNGWYQRPAGDDPFAKPWQRHTDFTLVNASCPILIEDVDGDGRADLIWGNGHNYGLHWERQLAPDPDGTTNWERKDIDLSFSQAHALAWADLDGDGKREFVTGKRVRAHSGKDPGATDTPGIYYYRWDPASSTFLSFLVAEGEVGIGLQIRIADMDGNGKPDIICAGKSGTHIIFNDGIPKPE